MPTFYLAAAVIGAVVPYALFFPFFQTQGFDVAPFVAALFVNGPAGGFTADLLISSVVFWAFMFSAKRRSDGPSPWPFVALNLCVGLSCALPAYLYTRHKRSAPTPKPGQ